MCPARTVCKVPMPRTKSAKRKLRSSQALQPKRIVADDPPRLQVGLPHLPGLYGLKPRKQISALDPCAESVGGRAQLWDLQGAPGWTAALHSRVGILLRPCSVFRYRTVDTQGAKPQAPSGGFGSSGI